MTAILSLGETITFGAKGNARKFLVNGWDASPVNDGTWTVAHVAQLAFQIAGPKARMTLELDAGPFVHAPRLRAQGVVVYLNGIWIGFVKAANFGKQTISFNGDVLRDRGDNLLSFMLPDAVTSIEIGTGNDDRPFGFCFRSLKIAVWQ